MHYLSLCAAWRNRLSRIAHGLRCNLFAHWRGRYCEPVARRRKPQRLIGRAVPEPPFWIHSQKNGDDIKTKTFRSAVRALALLGSCSLLSTHALAADQLSPAEAEQIALDAYVYGYSLMTTDVTRIQMSNIPKAEPLRAPLNQFANVPRYPPADYRGVSAPNADTLYSLAWIDLKEPQVFSHPDMGERYFLFPMVDLWMTIFNSPGSRTTGQKAGNFLLTGPGWKGEVPQGMIHIPVATRYMVILGRTYADGTEADYAAANALQAQLKITPLSAWGKPFTPVAPPVDTNPGISMKDDPQSVILAMSTEAYFNWMSKAMCENAPAYSADQPTLARFAKIGFEPCKPFSLAGLAPETQAALKSLPQDALKQIGVSRETSMGKLVDGWSITKGLGVYGTDYMKRAVVAAFGWPANLEDDAV